MSSSAGDGRISSDQLAINGGTPVRRKAMPTWPVFGPEEIDAVTSVLKSGNINYWTGPRGKELEQRWAQESDTAFAIAVSNGTVALELALRALGVGPGDEVLVPAKTFIASAGSVVSVGARPVIVDIDPLSNCLTAETCVAGMRRATEGGKYVKAIIAVHLGGWPVDMDPLLDFARNHNLVVVEDCAQAHGARYKGRPVGGIGDAGCFSFCQDKIVPVGEGGLVTFNEYEPYRRAWEYKDHGKSLELTTSPDCAEADGKETTSAKCTAPDDSNTALGKTAFKWVVDNFGTNARLGEMESALGLVGLDRLPSYHRRRSENAQRIIDGLAGCRGLTFSRPFGGEHEDTEHAYYRLYGQLDLSQLNDGWTRDRVLEAIVAEGTPVQYGSCSELYRERAFIDAGLAPSEPLPGAHQSHEESICFFVHPTLTRSDITDTVAATRKVLSVAMSRL